MAENRLQQYLVGHYQATYLARYKISCTEDLELTYRFGKDRTVYNYHVKDGTHNVVLNVLLAGKIWNLECGIKKVLHTVPWGMFQHGRDRFSALVFSTTVEGAKVVPGTYLMNSRNALDQIFPNILCSVLTSFALGQKSSADKPSHPL